MESNTYNSMHIISEAVVMGGISMYFYKKMSELEETVNTLKEQVAMQNNQIRYLLGQSSPSNNSFVTPIKIPQNTTLVQSNHLTSPAYRYGQQLNTKLRLPPPITTHHKNRAAENDKSATSTLTKKETSSVSQPQLQSQSQTIECEGGVCKLVRPIPHTEPLSEKKVAISKISKQIEFDHENNEHQTFKVNTFNDFSPNPVIKSITPKPSISTSAIPNEKNIQDSSTSSPTTESSLDKILNDIDHE
jgi:hypothetical protein